MNKDELDWSVGGLSSYSERPSTRASSSIGKGRQPSGRLLAEHTRGTGLCAHLYGFEHRCASYEEVFELVQVIVDQTVCTCLSQRCSLRSRPLDYWHWQLPTVTV